ncbi:hypothetical protein DIPPA_29910 [Diplonema papillatum]|nr:hypothetical protein DIPPA_29910 [Diplonema papillatum]
MMNPPPTSPQAPQTTYADMNRSAAASNNLQPGEPGFFYPTWIAEEQRYVPIFCMSFWGLSILVTLINYVAYIRTGEAKDIYGSGIHGAYIAFIVLGMITYFGVSATLWLWASKYATTRQDRKFFTISGIAVLWFLNDLPLWAIDYRMSNIGFEKAIQGASFVFNTLCFLGGGITVWLTYTYKVTTFLDTNYSPRHVPDRGGVGQGSGSVFAERNRSSSPLHTTPNFQHHAHPAPPPAMSGYYETRNYMA